MLTQNTRSPYEQKRELEFPETHLVAIQLRWRRASPTVIGSPLSTATLPLLILFIPLLISTVVLTVQSIFVNIQVI